MLLILVAGLWLLRRFFHPHRRSVHRPRGRPFTPAAVRFIRVRKPEWVVDEVVRLKALMGDLGCRKVADTFNRLHAARHSMTVSKSFVATTVRGHRLEIAGLRAEWKRRIPSPVPTNRIWGMNLTAKSDLEGVQHPVLGIVDHGSRFAVALEALADKSTISVLRVLLDVVERYGKPRAIRTDNEAVFTSRLFRFTLAVLGTSHQRTEPHCPWQNGRVERFFGTLKQKLDHWAVGSFAELALALGDFRVWYNAIRPHQHLHGWTPRETWLGIDPFRTMANQASYFSAWDGRLTGIYLRS